MGEGSWVSTAGQESLYESAVGTYVPGTASPVLAPAPVPAQPEFSEYTDLDLLVSRMHDGPSDGTDYEVHACSYLFAGDPPRSLSRLFLGSADGQRTCRPRRALPRHESRARVSAYVPDGTARERRGRAAARHERRPCKSEALPSRRARG